MLNPIRTNKWTCVSVDMRIAPISFLSFELRMWWRLWDEIDWGGSSMSSGRRWVIGWALVGAWKWRAAELGAGQGLGEHVWMGIWRIWGKDQGWQRTDRSGGVASWRERLTRISAEITDVKQVVVVVVLLYYRSLAALAAEAVARRQAVALICADVTAGLDVLLARQLCGHGECTRVPQSIHRDEELGALQA